MNKKTKNIFKEWVELILWTSFVIVFIYVIITVKNISAV